MASADDLRRQIAETRRDMEEAQRQHRLLTDECVQAQQRQDLRRELDSIRSDYIVSIKILACNLLGCVVYVTCVGDTEEWDT